MTIPMNFLKSKKKFQSLIRSIIIAVIAVLLASLIRKFFLGTLEDKVVWITFYPAVMVAAIFGGFFSGILTAILTVILVVYQWQLFTDTPFINGTIGIISTIVFLVNCSLISGISEYSRQQRIKANIQKNKAERASKAKSDFLANISHELRTPLNSILGFTRLMKENIEIPIEEHKNLEIINRSGEHLLGLINNVLDIAKIEAGRTTKTESTINLENNIYEVIQLMSQEAEAKSLELKLIYNDGLPKYIKTDKQKLKQILINLIGNAIKFTETGKITLIISEKKIEEIKFLILEITDTGIGIKEEDLKKIFTPFEQSSNVSIQRGTGLGLAISKKYAELLGGTISAESEIGIGSKFTVRVPLISADNAELSYKANKYADVKSIVSGQKHFKILIIEDQIENWLLLKRIHEKVGIQVRIAENGLQGLEIFKEWQPHLIWMDVRMPVMDGLEATKEIRKLEKGKEVKIIGISAHVFKDEIKNVMSVGMDSFVKKPYQFHEIYECLNEHLGVKFNFGDTKKVVEPKQLLPEMFENINKKSLQELFSAIKNLNDEQIELAINVINEEDVDTAQILTFYTKNLKYTEIFRILNTHLYQK